MSNGQAYSWSAHSPTRGTRADPLCVGYVRDGKVFSLISSLRLLTLRRRAVRLCSNDSLVLCRCVTPRGRARGPCGLSLLPPSCGYFHRRHLRGLPVLVHEVSRRVWGLRLRRTEHGLALSPLFMSPSAHIYRVGARVVSFRSSIAHPTYTPVYASLCPSR